MINEDTFLSLMLSFVSLKQLDHNLFPMDYGSGIYVNYKNKKFILTAAHGVKNGNNWYVDGKFFHNKGMALYPLDGLVFLADKSFAPEKLNIESDSGQIDFAFAESKHKEEMELYYQEIDPNSGEIKIELPKKIHNINFEIKPDKNVNYSFIGLTCANPKYETKFQITPLEMKITSEKELRFIKERYLEGFGNIYIFEPPENSPNSFIYKGCSGTPIMDNEGNVISLLVGGVEKENKIFGINLNFYKTVIDGYLLSEDYKA